jgi:hypothetical protein
MSFAELSAPARYYGRVKRDLPVRPSLRAAPTLFAAFCAAAALGQVPSERGSSSAYDDPGSAAVLSEKVFYGGYVGASFGEIEYLEIAPLVGYRVTPDFGMGLGLLFRYRKDTRSHEDMTSTDYGGNLFARYRVTSGLFLQGEYDLTSYEYLPAASAGDAVRTTYSSFLAGVGFDTAMGRGAGLYVLALYDFGFDKSDPYRPYDAAVQLRIGVSVGF